MKQFLLPAAAAALFAAGPVAAQTPAPPSRTIVVTGLGEASASPDMAILSLGVETQSKTAADALRQNGVQMRATIDRLKRRGVAEKDMQTSNLSVNPRYNYEENRTSPEIIGYVATNMLTIKLRDVDKAGAIIDDAVGDGANSLGGLSFSFADAEPLMNEARKAAVENAKDKAELYAKAAGVKLGPIIQIQDGYSAFPPPQPYMDGRAMAMEAKSTPISAGESTVSANVTLIYEIR